MNNFEEQLKKIASERNSLKDALRHLSAGRARLKNTGKDENSDDRAHALVSIGDAGASIGKNYENLGKYLEELYNIPPQQLVEKLDDAYPFLLLPVKIETKFRTSDGKTELWVRIFPDEIAVHTHEELLTEAEYGSGRAYWTSIFNAQDENTKIGAWNTLTASYGANRSAWIIKSTKPSNWEQQPADAASLAFPAHDQFRAGSWTEAPHSRVLPDKFVVTGYSGGKAVFEQAGNVIPANLQLAPDPSAEQPQIRRDKKTGAIIADEKLEWMFNFQKAEAAGMAMRIKLEEPYASKGLDRIMVLGIRASGAPSEGSKLVEELIDNHHYSVNGFSFLTQGTATNNTDDSSTEYTTNETSYEAETAEVFAITNEVHERTDGQRFADALGIDYDPLLHIINGNNKDAREAQLMNIALWPGTLGYFMSEMLHPAVSDEYISKTRNYFTGYVTGRGPLPSVRIGNQPYGILPVSAFSKWKWTEAETAKDTAFYSKLYDTLSRLQTIWQSQTGKISYAGKQGDPYKILLDMIGLQAGSVEFHERTGTDDTVTWNYLSMYGIKPAAAWFAQFNERRISILSALGFDLKAHPKVASVSFLGTQKALTGPLIDENPLSEEKDSLVTYDGTNNYIDWLYNSDSDTIMNEVFTDGSGQRIDAPNALLYLLLRNAYLQQMWSGVHELFVSTKVIASPVKEQTIVNIGEEPAYTKMDYMRADVGRMFPQLGLDAGQTAAELVLNMPSFITWSDPGMQEVKNAIGELRELSTARLERTLTEHLDLCTYRLDAWQTGMYTKRLEHLRTKQEITGQAGIRKGIYIGAFGWVEDVRPAGSRRKKADQQQVPEKLRDKHPVYEDEGNGGYIHGFSLNHAVAGAVLRSAHIAHAGGGHGVMSVNLSSQRVRMAMYYIDGVRNGQPLSSLLGYQLERGLHENHSGLELDEYIYTLREAFPLAKSVENEDGTTDVIASSNVVDGYALLEAANEKSYPYGVAGLPPVSGNEGKAIIAEVEALKDAMDAIGDLALAEGVYQATQGNFERGGAMMKALSDSKTFPDPAIVNTPRKGEMITSRITVHFENDPSYTAWGASLTPAATVEKGMNKWLGEMIGDPGLIRCLVTGTYTDITTGNETAVNGEVKLSGLQLQPLDAVLLTDETFGTGASGIEKHIAHLFRKDKELPDSAVIEIRSTERDSAWTGGIKTFFEMLPLLRSLRNIITNCRPLNALDLMLPAEAQKATSNNTKGYDLDDITNSLDEGRLDIAFKALEDASTALSAAQAAATTPYTQAAFDTWRDALKKVSEFGIPEAFPASSYGFTSTEYDILSAQTENVISVVNTKLGSAKSLLDHVPTDAITTENPSAEELMQEESRKAEERFEKYSEAARLLLGSSFTLVPRFNLHNAAEVKDTVSNSDNLIRYSVNDKGNPFIAYEWLQGAAKVRKRAGDIDDALMYRQNINGELTALTPLQLPFSSSDHWAAVEYPTEMKIDKEIVTLLSQLPAGYDSSASQSGLLVDEWTELIPSGTETTGIAFHYDQPNAMPPQTVLLAVAPQIKGHWTWQELMDTLNETFDSAKRRAVEPDHIDDTAYAQFLPAIMSAFSSQPVTLSTYYAKNIQINQRKI